MGRSRHWSSDVPQPAAPYTPAVRIGPLVAISGQVGFTRDRSVAGPDVATQTRQALENLRECLHAAGASLDDVLRCGVYLADLADFEAMNKVYAEFFAEPRPARTMVGAELAHGLLVEIDALAVVPDSRTEAG